MAYVDEVLADTPLVYYRLDPADRTLDSSGNGKTLTEIPQTDGFFTADGLIYNDANDAHHFNNSGSDGYFSLTDTTTIEFDPDDSFTVEMWAKITVEASVDYRRFLTWSNESTAGTNGYGLLYQNTLGWMFFKRNAGSDNSAALPGAQYTPRANQIYHVVGYFDTIANEIGIYVDAILQDTTADTSTQTAYTGDLLIGAGQFGGSSGIGVADEVAIYLGRLSHERIMAHYLTGLTPIAVPTAPAHAGFGPF